MLGGNMFEKYGETYPPNTIIFSEYEPGDNFYLIQEGQIRITKVVGDMEKTLDVFEPGDIFGEMAILEQQPRSATAITETEVKVLNFNRQNFELLLKSNPQIALKLLKMFAKRIYDAKRQLQILTLDSNELRVSDAFLFMSHKQGIRSEEAVEVKLEVTPEHIAYLSGISLEDCQGVLSQFSRQGKVEYTDRNITIKNINEFHRNVMSKRKQQQLE